MSFIYVPALTKIAKADADWDSMDARILLVMTNTTADTEKLATTLSAFTTLDEFDGSGYTRLDLAGLSVVQDDANLRAEIAASNGTFGSTVAAGTRSIQGMVVYIRVDGTAANDWPYAYIDSGAAFPFPAIGGPINLTVNTEGLFQYALGN
jgi:hypothetical protein